MKKYFVLGVLFILPLVAYLFFASGIHNFAKLPVLTKNIAELDFAPGHQLEDKITVLGFLGSDLEGKGPDLFNLNRKIYSDFYEFKDFQFVFLVPENTSKDALKVIYDKIALISDMERWQFVFAKAEDINKVFKSLNSPYTWNEKTGSPYIFIIDKNRNLRGRDDDEDEKSGELYGYDSSDIAELANKMKDDVKIILAEYRLALKKNSAEREK